MEKTFPRSCKLSMVALGTMTLVTMVMELQDMMGVALGHKGKELVGLRLMALVAVVLEL